MEENAKRIVELYIDYLNNYSTIEYFAECNGFTPYQAEQIIQCGRDIDQMNLMQRWSRTW